MSDDRRKPLGRPNETDPEDPLGSVDQLTSHQVPDGIDRRAFFMRSALIGATAIMLDRPVSAQQRADRLVGNAADTAAFPGPECCEGAKGPRV